MLTPFPPELSMPRSWTAGGEARVATPRQRAPFSIGAPRHRRSAHLRAPDEVTLAPFPPDLPSAKGAPSMLSLSPSRRWLSRILATALLVAPAVAAAAPTAPARIDPKIDRVLRTGILGP